VAARILVTGAAGFVGRAVCERLARDGIAVRAALRRAPDLPVAGAAESVVTGPLEACNDLPAALDGVDAVVHLAARAHVLHDRTPDPLAAYRAANADATARLAEAARAARVRRFVLMSSIKVNGEAAGKDRPFTEADAPAPQDAYGIAKMEAEGALRDAAAAPGSALEPVILRAPLVYGPGVRANMRALLRLCDSPWPLPFGGIDNRRSLLSLANLGDAVATALSHPAAAGETFLLSDGEDVSTGELIRRLRAALGRPARLIPAPSAPMRVGLTLLGRRAAADRLFGSLAVDSSRIRTRLGWTPPETLDDGLAALAGWWRAGGRDGR
jgi:nucleoside-diphosphate-sugar epimerase